jgi:hypothetical protein
MARKSFKEEIGVIRYMSDLAGPTFDYLKLCVTSGDKADKQWAVEQLMKLYPKAIPEKGDDPENPIYNAVTGINYIVPNGNNPDSNIQAASGESSPG